MALVNPNIAMGFRQPDIQVPNALAQYAQIQQIQGGQQAQELNALKMQEAQATLQQRNMLRQLNPSASDYEEQLFRVDPQLGIAYRKEAATTAAQRAAQKKSEFDLVAAQRKFGDDLKRSLSANPSDENIIAFGQDAVLQGLYTPDQVKFTVSQLLALPAAERVRVLSQSGASASELKPTVSVGPTGIVQTPAFGGTATVVPGTGAAFQMTPSQIAANQIAQGQLSLAQQKFAFEKANPGFELKEAEDGSIVGVNKRTLQAFPITMGGAAPAPAPMAGQGSPRISMGTQQPATQVIPGMTSVLDQQVPATAPVAGTPLRGKGTALTESQGNATAYGMRMREANAILEPLEKAGKTDTGLIKGVVGGAVGLVPFIGDKLEDASGSIFNALPQVLGGLSPEQQKVAQARINFITAILRKESGAAIGASEFATAEKNYFPKPGDDAATIAQKQAARKTAIKAMEIQAGPGAKQMGGAGGLPGASANDPLGLGIKGR
jgi:hypothetical protein